MNKVRRKKVKDLQCTLKIIMDSLINLKDEEQDYYDNMPENLQGSIRGTESEEAIDNMTEAIDSLESAIDSLDEI